MKDTAAERAASPGRLAGAAGRAARWARRHAWSLAAAAVASAALIARASSYLPFLSDDAFISLRYARRLLDGHGLTWTDGPRVEGYTNLLWTLACAGLGALGVDLVTAARALGLAGMMAAIAALAFAQRPLRSRDAAAALIPSLGAALTGAIAVWAVGGLEQPFVAAFLAGAIALIYPLLDRRAGPGPADRAKLHGASLLLGLLCLSRADGPLVCFAFGAAYLAAMGFRLRAMKQLPRMALYPVLLSGGQLLFRRFYYGDWVPNTARVKVAWTSQRLRDGMNYVEGGARSYRVLLIAAALGLILCVVSPARRRRAVFLALLAAQWLAYIALVGGDLFPARRQWIVAWIPVALLAAELARLVASRPGWGPIAAPAIVFAVLFGHAYDQADERDRENKRAREERWEWDGKAIGGLLREAFGERRALLAVDPAGAVPYYSGLPSVDMLGLNDHYIARHPPPGFGRGWMGHELGDGRYVLRREPDLVLFTLPLGSEKATFRSGKQMETDPRFLEQYRLLRFEAPRAPEMGKPGAVRGVIWTRVEGGRIGVVRDGERVIVPGFLFAAGVGPGSAAARLNGERRLVCQVRASGRGSFSGLRLGAGRWRLGAASSAPIEVEVRVSGAKEGEALYAGPAPGEVEMKAEGKVDIVVKARGTAEVAEVVLERAR